MLALSGEPDGDGRIRKSLDYLLRELSPRTAAASLSYGLLGLTAHERAPQNAQAWLEIAYRRTIGREPAPYRLALLALAALGDRCPLIPIAATRPEPIETRRMTSIAPSSSNPAAAPPAPPGAFDRRALLIGGAVALGGLTAIPFYRRLFGKKASVFIARGQRYEGPLAQTIRDGLLATGFNPLEIAGKRVLLKPNLVEPNRKSPQMTTHPAMVVAAAEVFRNWGATVIVGEGPGHVRDTELALEESNMLEALDVAGVEFADLNYEEVAWTPNAGRASRLPGFFFPKSVATADLIVSMPKMKTHHWVGFTASMKNLYGTIPGIKYGWPKNVLHHAGIPETVFDINASLPKTVAIVDGIVCMEGDGPIMGTAKSLGLVIVGTNPTAVDATVARVMGLEPKRVQYLQLSAERLGPIDERSIEQRGEAWREVASPFQMIDEPQLRGLQKNPGMLISSAAKSRPVV